MQQSTKNENIIINNVPFSKYSSSSLGSALAGSASINNVNIISTASSTQKHRLRASSNSSNIVNREDSNTAVPGLNINGFMHKKRMSWSATSAQVINQSKGRLPNAPHRQSISVAATNIREELNPSPTQNLKLQTSFPRTRSKSTTVLTKLGSPISSLSLNRKKSAQNSPISTDRSMANGSNQELFSSPVPILRISDEFGTPIQTASYGVGTRFGDIFNKEAYSNSPQYRHVSLTGSKDAKMTGVDLNDRDACQSLVDQFYGHSKHRATSTGSINFSPTKAKKKDDDILEEEKIHDGCLTTNINDHFEIKNLKDKLISKNNIDSFIKEKELTIKSKITTSNSNLINKSTEFSNRINEINNLNSEILNLKHFLITEIRLFDSDSKKKYKNLNIIENDLISLNYLEKKMKNVKSKLNTYKKKLDNVENVIEQLEIMQINTKQKVKKRKEIVNVSCFCLFGILAIISIYIIIRKYLF